MKSHLRSFSILSLALIVALTLIFAATGKEANARLDDGFPGSASRAGDIIPGRYVVMFREGGDVDRETNRIEQAFGFNSDNRYRHALRGFSARLSDQQARRLRGDPRIAVVEPDRVVVASSLPTGIDRMDVEENITAGLDGLDPADGSGAGLPIDVAIIDTGVDVDHPDLRVAGGARFTSFFYFGCVSGSFDDDNGHGTHVAGTIAARDNGDNVSVGGTPTAVAGVAPGARIWAVKVLNSSGSGSTSCVNAGVDWVAGRRAEFNDGPADGDPGINIAVANMSLSGGNSASLCAAIQNSVNAGVVNVVAAGNDGKNAADTSPANCAGAIAVSAIADSDGQPGGLGPATSYGADDTFASFSNFGAAVDIAAPGVNILSTYRGGNYAFASGTSMASPHVAGAAALFKLNNPGATPAQVRDGLVASAIDQASSCGFSGDPDGSPEPLVYTGSSCNTSSGPDITPPETTITSAPPDPTASGSATFEFSSEPGATFECSLDAEVFSLCSSPQAYSDLGDGGHTFLVRATDTDGNTDPTPDSHHWTVDTQPPDTSITSPQPSSSSSSASFEFTSTEPGSTFACSLDGAVFSACSSPKSYSGLTNSLHTFEVRATDAAGNTDLTPASNQWTVDAPTASTVLYFSLASNSTFSGLSVANEDIVAWDGSAFSLYFDGSDVGLSSFTIDAFSVISPTEILISLTAAASFAGLGTVDDSDIVKFTATSLGENTGGSFSLFFDGSDVGLSTSSEDVDAIELLPDGRLLVSTVGGFTAAGTSGASVSGGGEDIIALTATSLGATTAGSWAIYFDGSDVGMSSYSGENMDGLAIDGGGNIYISTGGSFSVPGLSGADEDIFVFTPSTLGAATSGSYSSPLFFDGSLYGLASNDVMAVDLPQ